MHEQNLVDASIQMQLPMMHQRALSSSTKGLALVVCSQHGATAAATANVLLKPACSGALFLRVWLGCGV
jgi:hypothetical protein